MSFLSHDLLLAVRFDSFDLVLRARVSFLHSFISTAPSCRAPARRKQIHTPVWTIDRTHSFPICLHSGQIWSLGLHCHLSILTVLRPYVLIWVIHCRNQQPFSTCMPTIEDSRSSGRLCHRCLRFCPMTPKGNIVVAFLLLDRDHHLCHRTDL